MDTAVTSNQERKNQGHKNQGANNNPLAAAKRVVVKVGSALLVEPDIGLRQAWLQGLITDLAALQAEGIQTVVVSSGSIALGRRILGLAAGGLSLEQAQAAASVGQIALSRAYAEQLEQVGLQAGQILLTLADTQDRRRYLNACATLKTLLDVGVVPVVNENDTIATDEIRYGDNDRLAARVALMVGADRLVLLSDIDGFYDANPREHPEAKHIAYVPQITPAIEQAATGPGTALASGGMATKVMAAKAATQGGCAMIIAKGMPDSMETRPLQALRQGGRHTLFQAVSAPQTARQQWIAGMKPMGRLIIDAGAVSALAHGASLLPVGLKAVQGSFQRGDPVRLVSEQGLELGAGLAGYAADEARQIIGLSSASIEAALGYVGRAALVHRDDMALWDASQDMAS